MANGQRLYQSTRQPPDPFVGGEQFTTPDFSALMGRIPKTEKIGYFERPFRFVSELVQGGDPMRALLKGRATKPSLGYALFHEAQEPGFQKEDIGAFAIDVFFDPLTYLLPPLIGKIGGMLRSGSKLGMAAFYGDQVKDITDKLKAAKLDGTDASTAYSKMRDSLLKLVDDGSITAEEQMETALAGGMKIEDLRAGMAASMAARRGRYSGELSRLKKDSETFFKAGAMGKYEEIVKKRDALKGKLSRLDKGGFDPVELFDDEALEKFAASLASRKFYNQPPSTGAFGNARRATGVGLAPIANVVRKYGGHWGARLGDALVDHGRTTSIRSGAAYRDLFQTYKTGPSGAWTKAMDLTTTPMEKVKGRLVKATKESIAAKEGVREAASLLTMSGIFDDLPKGLTPEFLRKGAKSLSSALENAKAKETMPEIIAKVQKALGPNAQQPGVMRLINEINLHGAVSDYALRGLNDPRALELAPSIRNFFRGYKQRTGSFVDARGLRFMAQGKSGLSVPFKEAAEEFGDTYFAQMWNYDEMFRGGKTFEQIAAKMAKEQGISKDVARARLEQRMHKIPKKAQNIELLREGNEGGYLLDPLEVLPRYAYNTEYRLAFAERFGIDGTGLNRLVNAVKKDKLLPEWYMDNIRDMAFGRNKKDYTLSQLVNWATGWQVITKMGPASTIANASQPINAAVIYGARNAMRAFSKLNSTEGRRLATGAYSKEVQNLLKAHAGVTGRGPANTWLEMTGFSPVERWNGFYSATMGDTAATSLAAKIPAASEAQRVKMLAKLKRWGARERHLDEITATGRIPYESRELIAAKAVEDTQHAMRWEQMPMMWQNDYARVALQYKNFAYNQTRFVFREVVNPAIDYLASYGKEGNLRPLLRMAPLFVGAGEAVTHLRDLIRMPVRALAKDPQGLSADIRDLNFGDAWKKMSKEKQREFAWNTDDWFLTMLRDTLMVGSAGMLGDMFEGAERGKLPEWLLGPTISDVTELATKGARATGKAYKGDDLEQDFWNFTNWAARRAIPGLGPIVPSGIELEKTAKKLLR